MALRSLSIVVALTLLIASGCKRSSNYQPPCAAPAVVATVPIAPLCPPGAPVPLPPPPGAVIVPR